MYVGGPGYPSKSLEQIGRIYGKTRQAVYDVFHTRGYELRSKKMKGLTIIDEIRFSETKGGYLRGTVRGRRMLAHQYIWEKYREKIPNGYVLFFKDGNPKNVEIGNLELVLKKNMMRKFNPEHLNQFTSPTGSGVKKWSRIRDKMRG